MKHTVTIEEWAGKVAFVTEATASDGRFLSLYTAPLPADPWGRWVYTVDTNIEAGDRELRPVALNIAYGKESAFSAARGGCPAVAAPHDPAEGRLITSCNRMDKDTTRGARSAVCPLKMH